MMTEELNFREYLWEVIDDCMSGGCDPEIVRERFDKRFDEFIRRLKEEAHKIHLVNKHIGLESEVSKEMAKLIIDFMEGCMVEMCKRIDKLAEEKLT